MISMSGLAQAASAPQAAGQIRPSPRALAPIAAGSTPATAAIEPSSAELAQHGEARERVRRDGADRRHQPERDRQIVMAAFLRQVGGREVDGDAPRRQREPGRDQRRAHPLARLRHRLVGQADDVERRQPRRHLHLDIDGAGLDALERHCRDALDHACPCSRGRRSGSRRHRQEQLENRRVASERPRRAGRQKRYVTQRNPTVPGGFF